MSNKTNRLNKKSSANNRKNQFNSHSGANLAIFSYLKESILIILLALGIFFLISFFSYHPFDPGWSRTAQHLQIANMAGNIGAWSADLFLYFFGVLAYLFPIMLIHSCIIILLNKEFNNNLLLWGIRLFGFSITLLSACGIVSLFCHYKIINLHFKMPVSSGGVLGDALSDYFSKHANFWGAIIILTPCMLAGITAMTGISWLNFIKIINLVIKKLLTIVSKNIIYMFVSCKNIIINLYLQLNKINKKYGAVMKSSNVISPASRPQPSHSPATNVVNSNSIDVQQEAARNFIKQIKNKTNIVVKNINNKNSNLPAVNLLEKSTPEDLKYYAENLPDSSNIQAKLADFGISVQIADIFPGPVVTRIEMELAPGTKASKITSLSKDLARSLSVPSVRVVEVIPGKTVVGLEIPNKKRALVRLREILSSEQYTISTSPLTLALGKDISGIPVVTDLSRMPHLLVAGTTGSGKSVGVNVMLLSILFKATPDDVRLILIDPKMLELSIYDGIPHLLTPVVTDMKDAANALNWCVFEMERRYKLMANIGVRNLLSFNHKVQSASNTRNPIMHPFYNAAIPEDINNKKYLEKLPYIVVIIDEFADMMMVVGKKVEEQISRIAQKARAAGIHMILATQRPSVDVITGLIKANIPTRIAFQVSSRIDSRTILDQQGAEQLLGHGDLLYLPPGSGIPVRIHGAFVSDEEVHKVVTSLKESVPDGGKDNFVISLAKMQDISDNITDSDNCSELDPLYDEAVAIVTSSRKASISYLQRRLKIGFNRAARLIEDMQSQNVVSTQNNGIREVLAPPPT